MKKVLSSLSVLVLFLFSSSFAQSVKIGPRLTANLNITNVANNASSYSGFGIGIGGNLDVSFSSHIGIITNLTLFDMANFSNSTSTANSTTTKSYALYYMTFDPMFKAEFSGFYMVGGPSIGIKLSGSGETQTINNNNNNGGLGGGAAQNPTTIPNLNFNAVRFGIEVGTGYNFHLSPGMYLATDLMAGIPLTNTIESATSNTTFVLKLGVALKFSI